MITTRAVPPSPGDALRLSDDRTILAAGEHPVVPGDLGDVGVSGHGPIPGTGFGRHSGAGRLDLLDPADGRRPPKRGELVVRYGQEVGVWVGDVEVAGPKAGCRDKNIQNSSEIELDSDSHCLKTVVCRHDGPFW
jgi:hypothetical protein